MSSERHSAPEAALSTALTPEVGTRARIVEAAWELVRERRTGGVSMHLIAQRASVSRQAIYLHFGSRPGLLLAMLRHKDASTRYVAGLTDALNSSPAVDGLEVWIRRWNAYVPQILDVATALSAEAGTDQAAREAWEDRMGHQLAGLHVVFERIAAHGLLATPWTPETAADFFWSLVHVDNYRHLVSERGWDPDTYTERLITTARTTFLRQNDPAPS